MTMVASHMRYKFAIIFKLELYIFAQIIRTLYSIQPRGRPILCITI